MSIPDISKFNDDELVTFLNSFDTILTDCDGVIWILGTPYEGASDAIAAFEALGKRVFYVTNNATRPVDNYVKAMTALGYNVTKLLYVKKVFLAIKEVAKRTLEYFKCKADVNIA
ncbi:Uncharacterized protein GBIM_20747, partial [Gryllus bimaculatus]